MALDSGLTVDAAQPLNLTHPLLRDVAGFWVPTESRAGGSRLYDLSPYGRHGDLFGPSWATNNDLTFTTLEFDGSDRVDLPDNSLAPQSGNFTNIFWGKLNNNFNSTNPAFYSCSSANWSTVILYAKRNGGVRLFGAGIGGEVFVGSDVEGTGWRRIALVRDQDTINLYIDGVLDETATYNNNDFGSHNEVRLGRDTDNNQYHLEGGITGLLRIDRALSSREIKADFDQARRGFPDLLNRRTGSDLYVLGGTGSGTGTTYTVSGTVTDSGGTAIQGATVSLENVTGAAQTTDTTDASGNYSISVTLEDSDLPDTWDVVASSSGYTEQLKQVSADTSTTSYTTDFSLNLGEITGTLSLVDGRQEVSAQGAPSVTGTAALLDAPEVVAAIGAPSIIGTMGLVEGREAARALGTPATFGTALLLDSGEIVSAQGAPAVVGTLGITDQGEVIRITDADPIMGTMALVDGQVLIEASGGSSIVGSASITNKPQIITGSGVTHNSGILSVADSGEILTMLGSPHVTGRLGIEGQGEVIRATGNVLSAGTLRLVDAGALVSIAGTVPVSGTLALTDRGEIIAIYANTNVLATLDVVFRDSLTLQVRLEDALTLDTEMRD